MRIAPIAALALAGGALLLAWIAWSEPERDATAGPEHPAAPRSGSAPAAAELLGDVEASPVEAHGAASGPAAPARAPIGAREPAVWNRAPAALAAEPEPAELETDVVRGRVRSHRGAWDDLDRLLSGHLRIDLLPGRPGARPFVARLAQASSAGGETWVEFVFSPVPRGAYVLAVSSTDALRIAPARLELVTPCAEIELWMLDDVATLRLGFRVLDAETSAPIEDFEAWSVHTEVTAEAGVLFHAGPLALDDVPIDAQLAWRVWAPGYVPASGDERAFAELVDGRWIAEVRLRRGWGRRFVALGKTPTMQPLRGARLELDGAFVGETNAAGELEVELPAAPERYSIRYGDLAASGAIPSDAEADRRARIHVLVLDPTD